MMGSIARQCQAIYIYILIYTPSYECRTKGLWSVSEHHEDAVRLFGAANKARVPCPAVRGMYEGEDLLVLSWGDRGFEPLIEQLRPIGAGRALGRAIADKKKPIGSCSVLVVASEGHHGADPLQTCLTKCLGLFAFHLKTTGWLFKSLHPLSSN